MAKIVQYLDCTAVFLDNIIITGRNDEEHMGRLKKLLQGLSDC